MGRLDLGFVVFETGATKILREILPSIEVVWGDVGELIEEVSLTCVRRVFHRKNCYVFSYQESFVWIFSYSQGKIKFRI